MTKLLNSERDDAVVIAANIIKKGGLVGLPTETVYGLAANALDKDAVMKIFKAKGRPPDNPLIIHIGGADELSRYCEIIPEAAYKLAEIFWPGPLTLVLPRKPLIPDAVTAGLNTVAVRCPDSPIALALIRESGVPLAAPSANNSGKPSPTLARHVLDDLGGKIDAVIDGGSCVCGIESTILDMTSSPPRLLRPGSITAAQIKDVLGADICACAIITDDGTPSAPGMKYRHYAPDTETVLLRGTTEAAAEYIKHDREKGKNIALLFFDGEEALFPGCHTRRWGHRDDWRGLSKNLYSALRELDSIKADIIYVRTPPDSSDNAALLNRLMKAAAAVIDAG